MRVLNQNDSAARSGTANRKTVNNIASAPISLTLTLSRWEREQPRTPAFVATRLVSASAPDRAGPLVAREILTAFLPLPVGEGRGEGEDVRLYLLLPLK